MALLRPRGERALEYLAYVLNAGPAPVVEAFWAPAQARALQVAVRTGMLARLARAPASAEALAAELGLAVEPTRLVLECLAAQRHVVRRRGRWRLRRRARPWLDPRSPRSVHGYLDHTADYWPWWGRLEAVLRGAPGEQIHAADPGDPAWRRYVVGQYELARLSAPEVARRLALPPAPRSLLDVGGAHGEFSRALCARHPGLHATVLDLPGAVAVGRELVRDPRVAFRAGDAREAELGGPHDAVLLFNVLHHLEPGAAQDLLARVHAALRPGGTLAVLELLGGRRPGSAAHLALFFHLTSGAATYPPEQLAQWLARAGFTPPRPVTVRRLPAQTLLQSVRP